MIPELSNGFGELMRQAGRIIKIEYLSGAFDPVYDEIIGSPGSWFAYSTVWTSGINLPLDVREGTSDALLLQQGLINENNSRLFISGGIVLTGSDNMIRIQLGSPTGDFYSVCMQGVRTQNIGNTQIYKKVWIGGMSTYPGQ